jgi:DinB superfamily
MTTSFAILPVLLTGLDDSWNRLWARLDGLSQAEYQWLPAEPSWSVRLVDGRWQADSDAGDPEPAPLTSIAWRMWHIASDCLASYVSPALGDWPLPVADRDWFGESEPALQALDTAYTAFRSRLVGLGEDGLRTALGPSWGPYAEASWADLAVHALDELSHHGAEIALLRDLYPHRG